MLGASLRSRDIVEPPDDLLDQPLADRIVNGPARPERITKAIETPVVRVQGDWSGAVDRVLAHKLLRWADGIVLEETDAIVACEGDSLERGEQVTVLEVEDEEEQTQSNCYVGEKGKHL